MTPQQQILVVGADQGLRELIRRALAPAGVEVLHAADGRKVPARCELEEPAGVLLDLQTLGQDGVELCRQIQQRASLPILVLGGAAEHELLKEALDAGAEDYLGLPFAGDELLLRVQKLRRRRQAPPAESQVLRFGRLAIDRQTLQVLRDGELVRLTPKERGLLEAFVAHPGQVLTHRMLLQHVWGDTYAGETNYLHTFMRGLRNKLEDDPATPQYFLTEVGVGYRLVLPKAGERATAAGGPLGVVGAGPAAPADIAAEPDGRRHVPPPEQSGPPAVLDFVGRVAELAYFRQQLAHTHLAIITGMTGVGKTTLAAVLASESAARQEQIFWHTFHEGQGVDGLIWSLAGFLAQRGQLDVWQMLQQAQQRGGQTPPAEVLLSYLVQQLGGHGYVLCFDDFQYVDEDPLLGAFAGRLQTLVRDGAVALIITSHRAPALLPLAELEPLGGLGQPDAAELLARRGLTLPEGLVAELHARTEGNPQLLLLACMVLQRTADPGRLIRRLLQTTHIDHFLMAKVDRRLTADERAVMGTIAALLGYPASAEAIEEIGEHRGTPRMLRDLSARSLLVVSLGEAGREYGQHAMVRAFYYDQLDRREQQRLHRRAGSYYEQQAPDVLKAIRHFQSAGDAAHAARLVSDHVRAIINHGQAHELHELLDDFTPQQLDPGAWVAVLLARAEIDVWLGASEQARASYERALAELAQLPESPALRLYTARACCGMGDLLLYDAPQEALDWLKLGLSSCAGTGSEEEAALYIKAGGVSITLGDYAGTVEAVERGLALLPAGPSALRVNALINLGVAACAEGDVLRGNTLTLRALEMSQQLRNFWTMIVIWMNMGVEIEIAGDWEAAEAHYQQALALATQLGSTKYQVALAFNLGILKTNQGALDEALAYLNRGVALARECYVSAWLVAGQASLADLHVRRGDYAATAEVLAEAEPLAGEVGAREQLPEIYRSWALVHLAGGEAEAARERAERAVELAHELGMEIGAGVSRRVLGQVQLAQGQLEAALESFAHSAHLLDGRDPYEAARTRLRWGQAQLAHAPAHARALLEEARAVFAQLRASQECAELERLLGPHS